ncbi:hypothetical protein LEQ41_01735 [Streptococcus agalactiae]|nr:hypothetical protein [Streptococcus agalactiae]
MYYFIYTIVLSIILRYGMFVKRFQKRVLSITYQSIKTILKSILYLTKRS